MIPETIEFSRAFLILFGQVVENGYSRLENIDADEDDRDDVREDFDAALSQCASLFSLKDDAETLGALADIVLAVWTELDEFLIDTTDQGEAPATLGEKLMPGCECGAAKNGDFENCRCD